MPKPNYEQAITILRGLLSDLNYDSGDQDEYISRHGLCPECYCNECDCEIKFSSSEEEEDK